MKHHLKADKQISERAERIDAFIDEYIANGGDAKKAWVDAGYSEGTVARANAKLREYWTEVEKRIHLKIGSHVPMSLKGIVHLAQNAKSETVQLKALQDIMARAGYDKPQEIVMTEKKAEEMDDSELKDELKTLLKKANLSDSVSADLH